MKSSSSKQKNNLNSKNNNNSSKAKSEDNSGSFYYSRGRYQDLSERKERLANMRFTKQIDTVPSLYDDRIAFEDLETIYFDHPIGFRGVNHLITETMSAGYSIASDDEKAKKRIEDWIAELEKPFDETLEKIMQQLLVGGNCFIELIMNATKSKVFDIALMDPNSIDYLRHETDLNKILRDPKTKLPMGYKQKDHSGWEEKVFPYEDVAHFGLHKISNSLIAVGLIEPTFSTFERLRKIEDSLAEAIYRHGFSNWEVVCGDMEHPPSAEDIDIGKQMGDDIVAGQDVLVHGPMQNMNRHEPSKIKEMSASLDYYLHLICAGFGIDKQTLLGSGEGANKATQRELGTTKEKHVRALQNSLSSNFQNLIFAVVLKKNYNQEADVWIEWGELRPEDKTLKVDRLTKLMQAGLLTYTEDLEELIRESEGLPPLKKKEQADGAIGNSPTSDSDDDSTTTAEEDEEELKRRDPYKSVDNILKSYLRSLKGRFGSTRKRLERRVTTDKEKLRDILDAEIDALNNDIVDSVKSYLPAAVDKGFTLADKPDIVDAMITGNLGYLTELTGLLKSQLRSSLLDGIRAGESVTKLRGRIADLFETELQVERRGYEKKMPDGTIRRIKPTTMKIPLVQRLEMIATEEVRESFRQSRINYYKENRPDIKAMEWQTVGDEDVCPDCETLSGKSFSIEKIPDRPHPNCRCGISASTKRVSDPAKVKLPITTKPKFDREIK